MIDTHAHLNFNSFENDLDQVIAEASKKGVEIIINVGTKLDSSQKAVELANNYKSLYAIVGIHPHHADKLEENWEEKIFNLAKRNKVVGIGEVGLDYYQYKSNGITSPTLQKEIFEKQILLSTELKLPLQIHNRHAGEEVIEILKKHKKILLDPPGMFHCFAGTKAVLKNALSLGFYIGFDGNATYKGKAPGESVEIKEIIKDTPLSRIVTETDSPYLTPEPYRGTRNTPAYVILVGEYIAKIKNLSFAEVKHFTAKNAKDLFHLS